ncbi:hypothetical protein BDQ17DRAFT_1010078 [Cyathus striatus]|nr:hypothetical protein BDQ17DRAFT_1010078 [Cyathus striatus]
MIVVSLPNRFDPFLQCGVHMAACSVGRRWRGDGLETVQTIISSSTSLASCLRPRSQHVLVNVVRFINLT